MGIHRPENDRRTSGMRAGQPIPSKSRHTQVRRAPHSHDAISNAVAAAQSAAHPQPAPSTAPSTTVQVPAARAKYLQLESPSWQALDALMKDEGVSPELTGASEADRAFFHEAAFDVSTRLFRQENPPASLEDIHEMITSDVGALLTKTEHVSGALADLQQFVKETRVAARVARVPVIGRPLRRMLLGFAQGGLAGVRESGGAKLLETLSKGRMGEFTGRLGADFKKWSAQSTIHPGALATHLLEAAKLSSDPELKQSPIKLRIRQALELVTGLALCFEAVLINKPWMGKDRFEAGLDRISTAGEVLTEVADRFFRTQPAPEST
jgi:hypothetical protein